MKWLKLQLHLILHLHQQFTVVEKMVFFDRQGHAKLKKNKAIGCWQCEKCYKGDAYLFLHNLQVTKYKAQHKENK